MKVIILAAGQGTRLRPLTDDRPKCMVEVNGRSIIERQLDDAETLMFDADDYLTEIGQKTTELARVQSQYIGLMRFQGDGLTSMLSLSEEAQRRSDSGEPLWRTTRTYAKMYMTDLLQGLIDEGNKLRAVHIRRGWFEIDDCGDLRVVESRIE